MNSNAQAYQPFPTSDTSWNVARCWYLVAGGWNDTYKRTVDGADTLYMGNTYKKVYVKKHEIHGAWDSIYPHPFFGGMRAINKQVFMFFCLKDFR
jgi:hypothetical protein